MWTQQEKNITFPTDAKLAVKIIKKCRAIAANASLELRQRYTRTVKENLIKCRFAHNPKRQKEGRKAIKKIKGIVGRLVRELEINLEGERDGYGGTQSEVREMTRLRVSN